MDANITISLEEFPDLGGTMGREIIGDDMNFLCRCLTGNDLLEKSHELRAGMTGGSFAEDFATLGIERGKERKRPVPIIFKTMPLRAPWAQGQHRIQPIQCLNGAFLVDAEYRCIDWRLEIQTDDIGRFFLELRIVTGKIAAQSMRLQPSFGQDARYPDVVGANFGRNLASRPMRRSINRFALGQLQHSGLESNAFFAATPSTMPAIEATEAFSKKALFPQSNGIDAAAHRPTGMRLTVAGRQTQNDLRAHGLSHAAVPSSGSTLQYFSLRRRNHDTFRHPFFLPKPHINNQCNSALVLYSSVPDRGFVDGMSLMSQRDSDVLFSKHPLHWEFLAGRLLKPLGFDTVVLRSQRKTEPTLGVCYISANATDWFAKVILLAQMADVVFFATMMTDNMAKEIAYVFSDSIRSKLLYMSNDNCLHLADEPDRAWTVRELPVAALYIQMKAKGLNVKV